MTLATVDTSEATSPQPRPQGLFSRVFGVLLSPGDTYAAVAARPRALGVLVVILTVTVVAQGIFLSTAVGQQTVLDQQVRAMEAFGVEIPDEAYRQMEDRMWMAPYTGGISILIFWPLMLAATAGVLLVVFSMLLGGSATFKHVYAVVAHSAVVLALQQLFSMPLSYARGEFAGANLGVFMPMLEEDSVAALFLSYVDLFLVWWMVNLAIGVGVLYKRRPGGTATILLTLYLVAALVVAFWRSGS